MAQANIGVVGMAVMGSNLARNLASREGNTVAIFNRSYEKTQAVLDAHPEAQFLPAKDYAEFAATLSKPRTAAIRSRFGGIARCIFPLAVAPRALLRRNARRCYWSGRRL